MGELMMGNSHVFKNVISDYEIARPGYPIELFKDIVEFSMLKNDAKVLEIGSGPGQATDYFVKNGYSITGLEIEEKQVQYLLEKYSEYHNFNSISDFHDLDNDKQKAILETVGDYIDSKNGKIVVPQEVRLYMAKK